MAKTVKLADIAAIVNVSTVTVSKALSDQKGVSEEMRARIKQLAKEMGYQTPTAARLSSNKRTYNIGVLISEIYFDQTQSFYWQMYQSVATKAVSKECFTLLEVLSMQNEKEMILPKLLQEEKMDGLIIIGMLSSDYLSLIERNIKVPYICLDFYDRKHEFDAVITDNFYGMYKLVNYLFEMGHKKIAYVGTLLSTNSITDRYMGYYKAMLEHGQEVPADYVIDDRSKDTRARCINYDFVLPKDISIVGFDNYQVPGRGDLDITTYEVDIKEMARKTINNLLKKIIGEHYKKGITTVEGHMVIKTSVKKL